jgi:hypothetical protein
MPRREANGAPPSKHEVEAEELEASGGAFGYLRGIRDHASAVEFRFRDGNSTWFPYAWLGTWRYNPSEGLLLKFSGDLVYLVLIRGSNLAKPLNDGAINLTHASVPLSFGSQESSFPWSCADAKNCSPSPNANSAPALAVMLPWIRARFFEESTQRPSSSRVASAFPV